MPGTALSIWTQKSASTGLAYYQCYCMVAKHLQSHLDASEINWWIKKRRGSVCGFPWLANLASVLWLPFSSLTLLALWQEGHLACRKPPMVPKFSFGGHIPTWSNAGKERWLFINLSVCVITITVKHCNMSIKLHCVMSLKVSKWKIAFCYPGELYIRAKEIYLATGI